MQVAQDAAQHIFCRAAGMLIGHRIETRLGAFRMGRRIGSAWARCRMPVAMRGASMVARVMGWARRSLSAEHQASTGRSAV